MGACMDWGPSIVEYATGEGRGRRAGRGAAVRLKCPTCGTEPVFVLSVGAKVVYLCPRCVPDEGERRRKAMEWLKE